MLQSVVKKISRPNWTVRSLQTSIFRTQIIQNVSIFSKLRLAPLCRRITLTEHKKYALPVITYYQNTHLSTFDQNSKPKGVNFDILHFLSFWRNLVSAFRNQISIEFKNGQFFWTQHASKCWKKIPRPNWTAGSLQTSTFRAQIIQKVSIFSI